MTTHVETQRSLARTALALLVAALMAFFLFSSDPSAIGIAQEPSATPSDTPTGFEINFINPSRFSEELSTRDEEGGDEPGGTYHLVAWVNALPFDAKVEFKYRVEGENEERLIGEPTAVSPGDTFELLWEIPDDIPEGEETFRLFAILYSGDTEIARDTEDDLLMNNTSPPDDDEEQGSTVELTYPVNGGGVGFFERQDRPTQGTIDTVRSAGSTESTDLEISVFYTTSPPGSEPAWNLCGTEGAGAGTPSQTRCSLAASHELENVTAVAALATDLTCDPLIACYTGDDDSGDAHRVLAYEQEPTTLKLTPDVQNESPTGTACSAVITATLTDQNERPIPNAPIDIHAVGPSDNLRFDDSGNNTSASQHPSGSHRREETQDCEANPPTTSVASSQGEHDNALENDLKHLESTLGGGTGDVGTFLFQLYSPNRGETQYTVFVDNENEDDLFCSEELSSSGSIGWAVPAPNPDGPGPEITSCAEATPSPVASRSPTASPSESPTEDPRGCTIVGTDAGEAIEGTEADDVICAGGGDDTIRGLAGNDTIYGDGGDDVIYAGEGNDFVDGGEGKDTIRLGPGNDRARGGPGKDIMTGGPGFDNLSGGGGSDTIRGGADPDVLRGGAGADTIRGGASRDTLFGNAGRDILHGDRGRDRCRGGQGKDRLRSCEA